MTSSDRLRTCNDSHVVRLLLNNQCYSLGYGKDIPWWSHYFWYEIKWVKTFKFDKWWKINQWFVISDKYFFHFLTNDKWWILRVFTAFVLSTSLTHHQMTLFLVRYHIVFDELPMKPFLPPLWLTYHHCCCNLLENCSFQLQTWKRSPRF